MSEDLFVSPEVLKEYKPHEIIKIVNETLFGEAQKKNIFKEISRTKVREIIIESCLKRLSQISEDLRKVGL